MFILPPSGTTRIMHRRPPQIPLELPLITPSSRPMQHRSIIPYDQIPHILPLHSDRVLRPRRPCHELANQLLRFRLREIFDVMQMGGDIEVHSSGGFVSLSDAVAVHLEVFWIDVFEEFWGSLLAGVVEGVGSDVVVG